MKNFKYLFVLIFVLISCSDINYQKHSSKLSQEDILTLGKKNTARPDSNPYKNAYFGDLHVHTENSFDAYTFGTTATPDDAYKYAQGEAIPHPSGYQIQLSRPLDFYAVTDHGVFLGVIKEAADTSSKVSEYEVFKPLHNINENVSGSLFSLLQRADLFRPIARALAEDIEDGTVDKKLLDEIGRTVWQETIAAADRAYTPGVFTTFAAYEYTSSEELYDNYLHRNVIFQDTKNLPKRLFIRGDSMNPEDLWDWMDRLRDEGVESLAIPHNSNISGGAAFEMTYYNGDPIDEAYAKQRSINEPLVEITQAKGTSETHPLLSKNDEWAAFELPADDEAKLLEYAKGSYVRNAYLRGLTLSEQGLTNPYKFGLAGASDTHVGGGSYDEETFFSKIGTLDGRADTRGSIPFNWALATTAKLIRPNLISEIDGKNYLAGPAKRLIGFSASGLTGVWAEENTREAIYGAFRRKETFATSGPRIKVRFFAGYNLDKSNLSDVSLLEDLYSKGTSMGGTLNIEESKNPRFLVWAIADSLGASLQRVQIIKGWLEGGEQKEKVFDVACSDGLSVDPKTNRCPDNEASVYMEDCSISNNGNKEIKTFWQDPEFNQKQEAFYYSRVLENPVCRWSTWDAIRVGEKPRSDIPATIQERAWSSPIWFNSSF